MAENPSDASRQRRTRVVNQPYAPSACNRCRKARTRCEDFPICKRCMRLGHECIRGPDHRKAITRYAEQNLRHQNEELRAQVDGMTKEISSLNLEVEFYRSHTHAVYAPPAPSSTSQDAQLLSPRNIDAHRLSDISDDGLSSQGKGPELSHESESEESLSSDSDDEDSEIEVINVDGRANLFREFGQFKYGIIRPFRSLRRRTPSQRMLRFKKRREDSPARPERHILMLPCTNDDEQEHCRCDPPCWARYLPPDVPMTRATHDLLLDRFFLFYSSWGLRILPEYFLRDMYRYLHAPTTSPPPRTAHYSPFLHLSILAVATAFSDDPELSKKEVRKRFADLAKERLEDEMGAPSLSAVQALSMLGSYHSGLGEQTRGFVYFGMSTRISQALGLGADCSQWLAKGRMKSQDVFNRYWCFQMECAQDACWALYVGREFAMPVTRNDPFVLVNLADPMLDCMTWRRCGSEPKVCRTFTTFLHTCNLMKISGQIMSAMTIISQANSGSEVKLLVADIDMQLITWREDLPDELKLNTSSTTKRAILPHVLMLHGGFWWLVILLHRPFYRRRKASSVDNAFSVGRCNLAAREILAIINIWRELYGTVRFGPLDLIQVVFSSGTVYLLSAHRALAARSARPAVAAHAQALEKVEEAANILEELGQTWPGALKLADIFHKLSDAQKQRMEERMQMRTLVVSGKDNAGGGSYASQQLRDLPLTCAPENGETEEQAINSAVHEVPSISSLSIPFPMNSELDIGFHEGNGPEDSFMSNTGDMVFSQPGTSGDVSFNWAEYEAMSDFPIDDASIFNLTRSAWGMVDGGSFPAPPFTVELGDHATAATGHPVDYGIFNFVPDTADEGDRALFEIISTNYA